MKKVRVRFVVSFLFSLSVFLLPSMTVHADDNGDGLSTAAFISMDPSSNGILKNTSVLNYFKFLASQFGTDLTYMLNMSISQQVRAIKRGAPILHGGFS